MKKLLSILLVSFTFSGNLFSDANYDVDGIEATQEDTEVESELLPELNPFFPTMLAAGHIIGYSAGYRTYDSIFETQCIPVSIGDQFSLYQIKHVSFGQLYFGFEACVWAIFEARVSSLSLINSDYYVGIPFTYFYDNFAAKVRIYHESSHLGDEFLLEHRGIERLNPSMEVFDIAFSYNFARNLTAFLGYSCVLRSDESFKIKPNGLYYGFNYFFYGLTCKILNLEGIPYIAGYFTNYQDNNWRLNSSGAIGIEFDNISFDRCHGHKVRFYIEAQDGNSYDGQFSKRSTKYFAIKAQYGY